MLFLPTLIVAGTNGYSWTSQCTCTSPSPFAMPCTELSFDAQKSHYTWYALGYSLAPQYCPAQSGEAWGVLEIWIGIPAARWACWCWTCLAFTLFCPGPGRSKWFNPSKDRVSYWRHRKKTLMKNGGEIWVEEAEFWGNQSHFSGAKTEKRTHTTWHKPDLGLNLLAHWLYEGPPFLHNPSDCRIVTFFGEHLIKTGREECTFFFTQLYKVLSKWGFSIYQLYYKNTSALCLLLGMVHYSSESLKHRNF